MVIETTHSSTAEATCQPIGRFDRTISKDELAQELEIQIESGVGNWALQESAAATRLKKRIGFVKCVADNWYVQEKGIWAPRSKDEYRTAALEVLPQKWRTHAHALQVINRVESERRVSQSTFCGAAKLDNNGGVYVAVQNGTLHITPDSVMLLPTDASHGFTTALSVAWDEGASMKLFGQVLNDTLPDSSDRELLLDVLATALIPDCRYEAALVCQGEAGTGKSTVIAPVAAIFGSTCASLSMADLCHPSGYKLAMLQNKLMNLATELNTLEMEDTGLFKQLVSGEAFTARPIYGKPFEMRSTATLVFLANSLPRFKYGTDAEVRRLRFIRFGNKVTKPDVNLKERVALEAPGLLVELVYRAQELLRGRPLREPGQYGRETVQRFAVSNDPVGQFVSRHCTIGQGLQCEKIFVARAFDNFRVQYGISEKLDDSLFFRTLYERFPSVRSKRARCGDNSRTHVLTGIELRDFDDL
jgi:P4 family phage/plasmid primase-like protien